MATGHDHGKPLGKAVASIGGASYSCAMPPLSLPDGFADTLSRAAALLNARRMPWMLMGGSAMMLYGVEEGQVDDIDIVLHSSDAERIAQNLSIANHADRGSERFRSTHLLHPDLGPVTVELMAGFAIHADGVWHDIKPEAQVIGQIGGQDIHLPSLTRLAEIFRLCGRDKDMRRAALIDQKQRDLSVRTPEPPV